MLAVLAGLTCVVAIPFLARKSGGGTAGKTCTDAVVSSPIWGERNLKYLGRVSTSGSQKWTHDETSEVEGGRGPTAGFIRVGRYERSGVQMVSVVVVEKEGRAIEFQCPWVGDGEYAGTMTDSRTGATSAVTVRVELPPLQD